MADDPRTAQIRFALRWSAAFHEAGHAVVGMQHGDQVEQLLLMPSRQYRGLCVFAVPRTLSLSQRRDVAISGDVAQALFAAGADAILKSNPELLQAIMAEAPEPQPDMEAPSDRLYFAHTCLAEGLAPEQVNEQEHVDRAAVILWEQRAAVHAIAERLMAAGRLEGAEVHKLCHSGGALWVLPEGGGV